MPIKKQDFQEINPCEGPDETECYVSWSSYQDKHVPKNHKKWHKGSVAINPITWNQDTAYSLLEEHKGVLMKNYKRVYKKALLARVHDGLLWVTKPNIPFVFLYATKNYHIGDYNLFWFNIRENANRRTKIFLEKQKK